MAHSTKGRSNPLKARDIRYVMPITQQERATLSLRRDTDGDAFHSKVVLISGEEVFRYEPCGQLARRFKLLSLPGDVRMVPSCNIISLSSVSDEDRASMRESGYQVSDEHQASLEMRGHGKILVRGDLVDVAQSFAEVTGRSFVQVRDQLFVPLDIILCVEPLTEEERTKMESAYSRGGQVFDASGFQTRFVLTVAGQRIASPYLSPYTCEQWHCQGGLPLVPVVGTERYVPAQNITGISPMTEDRREKLTARGYKIGDDYQTSVKTVCGMVLGTREAAQIGRFREVALGYRSAEQLLSPLFAVPQAAPA